MYVRLITILDCRIFVFMNITLCNIALLRSDESIVASGKLLFVKYLMIPYKHCIDEIW
ncbi:MAG UNVERIFIED_CONTAM: hypothetical protein LVQ98_05865 [Rickettsiaceae bacterium]